MGVAISYWMATDDPRTVITALKIVREEAEKAGYSYRCFDKQSLDEKLPRFKVAIIVDGCASAGRFTLIFRKCGRYYTSSYSTKTQPFTADEVEPNLRWHKWVCTLLKKLERLKWRSFYVHDGAGYYDTWDESKIIKEFQLHAQFFYKFMTTYDEMAEKQGLYTLFILGGRRVLDVRRLRKRGVKRS